MWWIFRQPPFLDHGMVAAFPESDLVIVNRANTYEGERTPMDGLLALVAQVLAARTGEAVDAPSLVPLEDAPAPPPAPVSREQVEELLGTWPHPPEGFGREGPVTTLTITLEDGSVTGMAAPRLLLDAAFLACSEGDVDRAGRLLDMITGEPPLIVAVARAVVQMASGDTAAAIDALRPFASAGVGSECELLVNELGYGLLGSGALELARELLVINVRLHPHAPNAWDSLGEALMELGEIEESVEAFDTAATLAPDNAEISLRLHAARLKLAQTIAQEAQGQAGVAPVAEPADG